MNLTGQNVAAAFKASLFQPGQPTDTAVIAEGVVMKAGFDPVRLEAQRAAVVAMIAELQDPFFEDTGGGWSFLNLCERRDGELWGQHQDCDANDALANIQTALRSFEPKHEHKMAGVAYLMSMWLEDASGEHLQALGA